MELLRKHVTSQPTRFAAYVALECALMRRYVARGGTVEEFCSRLAPIFRRRFGPILIVDVAAQAQTAALPVPTPRLRQEPGWGGKG